MKRLLCAILAMALVILPVGGSVVAYAEEAEAPENTVQVKTASYKTADYSGTTGTCYWYIEDGILYFEPQDGVSGTLGTYDYQTWETENEVYQNEYENTPWYSYSSSITGVEIKDGVQPGTNLDFFFYGLSSATYINFPEGFDTSQVTSLVGTFYECSSLISLDLNGWDTASVTTLNSTFYECESLTSLDISGWDVSNVKTLCCTFSWCTELTSLDLSSWNTSNVQSMLWTFMRCESLTVLDLSSWDTSSLDEDYADYYSDFGFSALYGTFSNCSALVTIYVSKLWNISNGIYDSNSRTFLNCTSLVGGNGTTYDSSHTDSTYARIDTESTPGYLTDIDPSGQTSGGSENLKTQKITVKKSQLTKTIHTKKLKKKNQTFKLKATTSGNGKITYKKTSGNKKIKVSKAGKVTVKKGLKKGKTYKVKVKVTAAKTSTYKKATKTVTLKIKIK